MSGATAPLRILFSTEPATGLLNHLSVVEELAARGHDVTIAVHGARDSQAVADLAASSPSVHIETVPDAADAGSSGRWTALAADVRSSLDHLAFLDDRFNETYRARSRRRVPRPLLLLSPIFRWRAARAATRVILELVERAIPADAGLERYLRERSPDVVLLTPYLGLRTQQVHLLRAAKALGLRTGICVKSWDNLTSKSAVRPLPERVFVWNETQREEARSLHGVDPTRVAVTGAQCFDAWLTQQPRTRDEFAAASGIDASRRVVLYTCCAPWTGQSELPFVRRWLEALRASSDELVAGASVVVRQHPKRPDDIDPRDLENLGPVVVFPVRGTAPTDAPSRRDYLDSIAHADAVVGLNTTAMLEASLLDRSVLTVLDPEYHAVQRGTLHFRYLLETAGGFVEVAHTLDEHVLQLAQALREPERGRARARAFVEDFVRPHGRERAATPIFVDEVERLAAEQMPAPWRAPTPLRALRPLLAPLARRSARTLGR